MLSQVEDIFIVVDRINPKPCVWSYLTSIEYMLRSKMYMNFLLEDAKMVNSELRKLGKKQDKPLKVLDIGTGSGIFASLLRKENKRIKLEGIDAYVNTSQTDPNFHDTVKQQKMLWKSLSSTYKINFSHYDGLKLPFKNESFDVITAYAVIEHVYPPDLDKVMKEMRRVLRRGGLLFIFKCPRTLSYNEHLIKSLGIKAHDLLFSDRQVKELFKKHKFEIIKHWHSDMVPAFPAKLTNPLYKLLKILDRVLTLSPLQIFAHHNNLVVRKT